MKKIILLLLAIFAISSCDPTIDTPIGTRNLGTLGTDNKSFVYVAIGTSISAGFNSGAIYASSQDFCFPQIVANSIGVSEFVQIDIPDPGIGERRYLTGFSATATPMIVTKNVLNTPVNLTYPKAYNNLSLYRALAYDLIDTSDFGLRSTAYQNPFYPLVLRNQQFGKSMADQAISLNPNLISIELGIFDIMIYAASGATKSTYGMPNDPIPTPVNAITSIFQAGLTKLTQALPNTKIVVFTIPNMLAAPYFNTIPWNALVLNAEQATALTQAYSALGFKFNAGANGFVAYSPKSPGGLRQLTANDCLLLTVSQDSLKAGWGSMKPIPNEYVLDSIEIAVVQKAVEDYNNVIYQLPNISGNISIFHFHYMFANGKNSTYSVPGSSTMTTKFISGEMFSLDGIHPTSKLQGAIANEFIKFLNMTFCSDLPLVNISNLPANTIITNP